VNLICLRLAATSCTAALLFIPILPAQDQGEDKVDLGPLTQIKKFIVPWNPRHTLR